MVERVDGNIATRGLSSADDPVEDPNLQSSIRRLKDGLVAPLSRA